MRYLLLASVFSLALASISPASTIVYDNTAPRNTDVTFFSSYNSYTISDSITLTGSDRVGIDATFDFANYGYSGTFAAALQLFNQAGASLGIFKLDSVSAPRLSVFDVSFNLGGVVLPTNLGYNLTVSRVSRGVDLGVLTNDVSTSTSSSTYRTVQNCGYNYDQEYSLKITATSAYIAPPPGQNGDVPEPGTAVMMLIAAALVGGLAYRRNRREAEAAKH